MKEPKEMTNEELAAHIAMWLAFGDTNLNTNQLAYFNEVIWRLRLIVGVDD